MKRQSTRTVLFLLLICLSIASYAYINLVERPVYTDNREESIEQTDEYNETNDSENAVNLPDVRMLRTAIEAGKRILPAS